MTETVTFRLARPHDARFLALMARDLVERGLGWTWTPPRVLGKIRSPEYIVLVAETRGRVIGCAVMYVGLEEARLNLLTVLPCMRRRGIGRQLIEWLVESALVAGVSVIYLEVRAKHQGAVGFYRRLGFVPVQHLPGYYRGCESALRMGRDLWETASRHSET